MHHAVEKLEDHLDSALVATFQIHQDEPEGDILVFLTGQEEIESAQRILEEHSPTLPPESKKLLICPIFASLPTDQQSKVFEPAPPGTRKVILSTNIAETSITISGIRYVVDTGKLLCYSTMNLLLGMCKIRTYNPRIGIETLAVSPISKASAQQRTGRAGREAAGACYRLYTEDSFNALAEESEPEIRRVNLASVLLLLKASGVEDVIKFDYIDKPSRSSRTFLSLFLLSLIIQLLRHLKNYTRSEHWMKLVTCQNLVEKWQSFPLTPPLPKSSSTPRNTIV